MQIVFVQFPAQNRSNTRHNKTGQTGILGLPNIMAVQIFQLLQIETRRRSADAVQIKQFDRPITRNDFLVTIAPAEPQQIIGDSFRQHSHIIAIGITAQGSVTLGKLGNVSSRSEENTSNYST